MSWSAIARIMVGGERGTGFLVSSDGLVLTAFHVIADYQKSKSERRPVYRPGVIAIRFGNPENEVWDNEATIEHPQYRFSIDDDWALLAIKRRHDAAPLTLAPYPEVPEDFVVAGFPRLEAEIGGEYQGKLGLKQQRSVELDSPKIVPGLHVMGGISGAPCMVAGGRVVALVQRALTNLQGVAHAARLNAIPIELVVKGWEGLIDFEKPAETKFEQDVSNSLPNDQGKLQAAAQELVVAVPSRIRVARRLLASALEHAVSAIKACLLDDGAKERILDCVAAMHLHGDPVQQIRTAGEPADGQPPQIAVVQSAERRIHLWYVKRAFDNQRVGKNEVVVIRPPSGGEELVQVLAETPAQQNQRKVEALVQLAREAMKKKWERRAIDQRLSPTVVTNLRFWLVVVGEVRPAVLDGLRARLPNAQILLGLGEASLSLDGYITIAFPVSPSLTLEEEERLLNSYAEARGQLDLPVEMEMDG